MLAVFVAELAPAGLQWITAACFSQRHNWKKCPPHIQVLEMSKLVARFAAR
jgi:hypothetical protein